MINYIIQVILFQVLFLAIYDFFLSKETFFTKNRWYLLSTPILSFLLPLVKIPSFQKAVPEEYIVFLPEIILSPEKVIQEASWYQSINYIDVLFGIGVVVFSVLFFVKLLQIISLIRSYKLTKKDGYTLVLIPKQTKAFSFFNYIFLGGEIPESQKEQVIAHELVHSKQKHSLDLLLFEFLKIIMWFNPMIFIYQKRITLVHEYISDEVATKNNTKENYINQLLSSFFQVENIAFINQFYKQTLIKKRIIMMKKNKSKKMNQLKYLVLIPVLTSMLFYTSCSSKRNVVQKEERISEMELMTKKLNNKDKAVSFLVVEDSPTFPGCDSGDKDCFSKKVQMHFARNFDSNMLNNLGLSEGKKRVFIAFTVNDKGFINDLKVRAPHPMIKEEVIRVMKSLPKMKPGKHNGNNVAVNYTIPFTLLVGNLEKGVNNNESENNNLTKKDAVSFKEIDKAPTFPGCSSGNKDCFSKMIQKHFSKNFNTEVSKNLGLSTGKKRIFISLKVNKIGDVESVIVRAPHVKIKEEVERVMSTLPKMIPGEKNEEKVSVQFFIPVNIMVEKAINK